MRKNLVLKPEFNPVCVIRFNNSVYFLSLHERLNRHNASKKRKTQEKNRASVQSYGYTYRGSIPLARKRVKKPEPHSKLAAKVFSHVNGKLVTTEKNNNNNNYF